MWRKSDDSCACGGTSARHVKPIVGAGTALVAPSRGSARQQLSNQPLSAQGSPENPSIQDRPNLGTYCRLADSAMTNIPSEVVGLLTTRLNLTCRPWRLVLGVETPW